MKFFNSWVFDGIGCAFVETTPKLLTVFMTFLKLKGSGSDEDLLQQEIWKLKNRPEAFIQKVPPLAKSKLAVRMYDESFSFEPENYTKISLSENSAGDEKKELYTAGKEVDLAFFHSEDWVVKLTEEYSDHKYRFNTDTFHLEFTHPLTGKDPNDKLYQFTKDINCSFGSPIFMSIDNGYTGKFCAANCPFTFKDLLPDILKSMDKQFDFVEPNGERMQWYKELLEELKNPSKIVNQNSLESINKGWMNDFYTEKYSKAITNWESLQLDYLLGEDLEATKQK